MPTGTSMGIVRPQLERRGIASLQAAVTPDSLKGMAGAAVMNSWTPGIAVSRIGSADMPLAPDFLALLHESYRAEPRVSP